VAKTEMTSDSMEEAKDAGEKVLPTRQSVIQYSVTYFLWEA
jgi:hypothetical protein